MKTWHLVLTIIIVIAVIVGCVFMSLYPYIFGNKKFLDTKWNYEKAYIDAGGITIEVEIDTWTEDSTTFTIIDKDGNVYCTHQENVLLVKGK